MTANTPTAPIQVLKAASSGSVESALSHAIILHHYPASPFAEKIRLFLGYKQAHWYSVDIPMVMPKPGLTALTGGYRKTPVMQIGADIYCDTSLILEALHQRLSDRLLLDEGCLHDMALAAFADSHLFSAAVAWVFQPEAIAQFFEGKDEGLMQAFIADRKAFRAGASSPRPTPGQAKDALNEALLALESQLSDARSFVWGSSPSKADFSLYHPLWFIRQAKSLAAQIEAFPQILGWLSRMEAFGHGECQALSADEALSIAAATRPQALGTQDKPLLSSAQASEALELGAVVAVSPTDYGMDPVQGRLCFADHRRVVVERETEDLGLLHVHFPQRGYRIQRCKAEVGSS